MKWLAPGALAAIGAAGLFFGLAFLLGLRDTSPWIGVCVLIVGGWALYGSGSLLRPNLARAFLVPGLAFLIAAGLVAVELPTVLRASDALQLWILMGSGIYLFFGLSLVIASGFCSLTSSKA